MRQVTLFLLSSTYRPRPLGHVSPPHVGCPSLLRCPWPPPGISPGQGPPTPNQTLRPHTVRTGRKEPRICQGNPMYSEPLLIWPSHHALPSPARDTKLCSIEELPHFLWSPGQVKCCSYQLLQSPASSRRGQEQAGTARTHPCLPTRLDSTQLYPKVKFKPCGRSPHGIR